MSPPHHDILTGLGWGGDSQGRETARCCQVNAAPGREARDLRVKGTGADNRQLFADEDNGILGRKAES